MYIASYAVTFSRNFHASQQIEMRVTMEIDVGEIRHRFGGAGS